MTTPEEQLGSPRELIAWLTQIGRFPGDGWLVIRDDTEIIRGDLVCWPKVFSARDLSDDEYDQLDDWLNENGYEYFLNQDQLGEIVENLRQQDPSYSTEALVTAVNFYWRNDAFIDIGQ